MAISHPAELFDGQSAASHDVTVSVSANGLAITGAPGQARQWTFSGLEAASPVRNGETLRLKHTSEPNARLNLPAGLAADQVLEHAIHLASGFNPAKALKFAAFVVVGLTLLVAAGYAMLNIAPQKVAAIMPAEWRDKLADHTEKAFIKDAKQCDNPAGKLALAAIAGRVAAASAETPDFSVRVFDMPFINAFALPGGRVVLTGKLIQNADSPEEVAGVIAHEIGHTAYLHPEASLVRNIGLQLLINLGTGGSGGDTLGNVAGLLTMLQYSRDAEREADEYAVKVLTGGSIDPKGLRHFFEKLNKKEWSIVTGKWKDLSSMLSTHPGTKERIEFIKPLPAGEAREVVPPVQWKALKKICS